jgi:hypothetical protein
MYIHRIDIKLTNVCNLQEKRPSIKKLLSFPFFKEDFLPAAIPVCALKRPPTELDYARNANASKAVTSPDNAAAALQRASQRDEIYARKPQAPLENLELLSGTSSLLLNLSLRVIETKGSLFRTFN